jgi:ketosteroid isomerase-like protein
MSQENVGVIKASFDVWNSGDMDAFRQLLHSDVITRPPENWPEPGPFVGREAVMREFEWLRGTWDVDVAELIGDFIEAGEWVAVRWIWRGTGRGPAANMEMSGLYRVRDGKIVSLDFFWVHAEALEAMGLMD